MKRNQLDSLKAGTLHLDCVAIELRNHDGSRTYSGPGYIRQDERHGFEVTVFVAEPLDLKDAFASIFVSGTAPGVLLPHTHYWSMSATDTEDRTWKAKRILRPSSGGSVGASAHIVSASLRELVSKRGEEKRTERVRCHLRAFTKVRFPRNQHRTTTVAIGDTTETTSSGFDVAEFTSLGFKFELLQEGDEIVLHAGSETATLHRFFESRVSEALLFVLGTHISWSVVELFQGGITTTKIRAVKRPLPERRAHAPISFNEVEHADAVWRLFGLYLAYVWQDEESFFHRLSGAVLALVRSTDGSVEAEALTAAVEVESVLDRFFQSVGILDEATTRGLDGLLVHLRAWTGDATLKERAVGCVSQLKSVRPADRLRELIKQNAVSKANVTAWRKLRNSVAHGDWSAVNDLQSFIDQTGKVQVLFYQLLFHLIHYVGKHTDWGTHGWPLIDYPPTTTDTAPPVAPSMPSDSQSVSSDAPSGASDASSVSSDAPSAASDAPAVASDSPSNVSDAPSMVADVPSVASDAPSGTSDVPSVASDDRSDTSDAP